MHTLLHSMLVLLSKCRRQVVTADLTVAASGPTQRDTVTYHTEQTCAWVHNLTAVPHPCTVSHCHIAFDAYCEGLSASTSSKMLTKLGRNTVGT